MEFFDRITRLASRLPQQLPILKTEEATKNALVMPLINALGYNVFDPHEVIPEFTADVGTKKGEKVDYASTSTVNWSISPNARRLISCSRHDLRQSHATTLA